MPPNARFNPALRESLPGKFDAIVVGGGVAGCALAYALANDDRRVLLLERDLSEPDRIVGELMQPGGCLTLRALGMEDTLEGIDGIDCEGYVLIDGKDMSRLEYPALDDPNVHIPGNQVIETHRVMARGKSFHHGRFIMALRQKCLKHPNVEVVEATVTGLVRDSGGVRVRGINAIQRRKRRDAKERLDEQEVHLEFHAPLTFVADGAFSKFRKEVLGTAMQAPSHFIGLILHDVQLPSPNFGHVVLAQPSPILLYQIGTHETRILVDVPGSKYPSNAGGALSEYLRTHVTKQLPEQVRQAFVDAVDTQRPRVMPNPYLPPSFQGSTPGLVFLGDAHNMRHPLTGGGMSVALNDALLLSRLFGRAELPSLHDMTDAECAALLRRWYWERKSLGTVVNVLANALYSLFAAGDSGPLRALRRGAFDYLGRGGECTRAPVRLLSCLAPQPALLVRHFFQVALYTTWRNLRSRPLWYLPLSLWENTIVMFTACRVIFPLCWYEWRGAPRISQTTYNAPVRE